MKTKSVVKPAKAVKTKKPAVKASSRPKKVKKETLKREPLLLLKGQLWKVNDVHLQVIELGKTLIHYRHFKQHHRVPTSIASIISVQNYLSTNHAVLIENNLITNKARVAA